MAVTLTETVGGATSNSYVTETEANSYFDNHPDETTWDGLASSDLRKKYLILATMHIDMEPIDGEKYTEATTSGVPNQALRFPRTVDYDTAKYIPGAVKKACYEQALYVAKTGTASTRATLQDQGVTSISIGDTSESYGGRASGSKLGPEAKRILANAGLLKTTGRWDV